MTRAMMELDERLIADDDDEQSFAPTPPRVERPRGRHRIVKLTSLEGLPKYTKNRYEAVLIAAARARQLNAKKIALEERGAEEALDLKRLKMTTFALNELVDGKIEVERPGE